MLSPTFHRGDLLLFKHPHDVFEHLICAATHGPYFHTSIALDEGIHDLAAHTTDGIRVSLVSLSAKYDIVPIAPYASDECVKKALDWAMQQVGKQYGWADIAFQAVKFFAPNNPFQLTMAGHWDCSDFVTRYLQHAGVVLPDAFEDPYRNTPADIARMFGLLSSRFPTVPKREEYA